MILIIKLLGEAINRKSIRTIIMTTSQREVNEMHDAISFPDPFICSLLKPVFKNGNIHIMEERLTLNIFLQLIRRGKIQWVSLL